MRRVWDKKQEHIAQEWDAIAEARSKQITEGKDISYEYVLTPTILRLALESDRSDVLDVGCGCGFLTAKLAAMCERITAIDISSTSIRLAERHCDQLANVRFVNGAIEELKLGNGQPLFSLAVANMSLMAMLRLDAALSSLAQLIVDGGHLLFTITHPCFWPQYWEYATEWFRYGEEVVIEAPFRISLDESTRFLTTHVHRPIEQYIAELWSAGFRVCRILEPMPPREIESLYPKPWEYPRFLAALCIKCDDPCGQKR